MPRFAELIGHDRTAERLRRAVATGRIPAAILLLGPPGIGKRTLADALAALLLCEAPAGGDACGACPQCTRTASGTHPDLRVVVREEDRRDVRIEQVRELTRWLVPKPLMAARKVAILDEAHLLNEHGQNALLKTLEEPPPSAVLVLCATSAAHLLPTVRSRCQIHRLDALPREAVARVLAGRGVAADRVALLAARAEGAPGRILALDDEEATQARARLLDALPRLGSETAADLSRLSQELARGPLESTLAAGASWYRDVLEAALLGPELPLRNPDVAPAVHAAAPRLAAVDRLRQLEVVCGTLDALGRNANRMLAVETMCLRLRAIERGERVDIPAPGAWTSSA